VKNVVIVGLVAIAVYLLLALTFSQVMPFSRAFDEGYHLDYITFIKEKGHLPKTYADRAEITRADFPPLYHLLVSLTSVGVTVGDQPDFKYFWDSYRYQAVDHQVENIWSLPTLDFARPYFGRFLVWQIGRWTSIFLSLATLVVVFFTLRDTPLKQYPWGPLAGAALLAFIPRYLILGSTLNDDNLLGLLAALYFWMLVKIINNPRRWWPFLFLGVLLGLSLTVKYTLVVVPLEILVVCAVIANKYRFGWVWVGGRLLVVAGLALLFSSWWFGWNIWFLNTVADDGLLVGLSRSVLAGGNDTTLQRLVALLSAGQVGLTELPADTNVGSFGEWVNGTYRSFWGVGGLAGEPLAPYVYWAVAGLLVAAGWGLWGLWRREPSSHGWLLFFAFHITIFVILPLVRFWLTRRLSVSAQGRHILIPAATALVALLVWGLATAVPRRWQKPLFAMIIALFIGWTGLHLLGTSANAGPLLPVRTMSEAAERLPQSANVQFGDEIELVSYELDPQPEDGKLNITLAWRSTGYVNENYLVRVLLLDDAGDPVSQWIGYHGDGRLPTLAWDPGDSVFDRLALPLPNLAAGHYSLLVQLIGQNGQPVPAGDADSLVLAELSLPASADIVAPADAVMWRSDGPSSDMTYRYPGTISVITADNPAVELVGPYGNRWLPEAGPDNLHTFVIGPRWPSGQYQVQLDGQPVGPRLSVENWWVRQYTVPEEIEAALPANFANQVHLLGYTLPRKQVRAGEAFPITLYWQAPPHRSPQANFIQFNHLLDGDGNLRGGYDRRPLEYYSTLLWAPGEIVVDGYAVPVNDNAPPGEYYLDVGFYLPVGESAVNLPLVVGGEMSDVSSVTVGPIEIVAPQ
jgi:hypothetical protein